MSGSYATFPSSGAPRVAVLGAGIAGLAAACKLEQDGLRVDVYEQDGHVGGHTASHTWEGFTFDEGPHISFTRDRAIQELLAASVEGKFRESQTQVWNYWGGHWLRHPAQCYLHGMPPELVERCLLDFVAARQGPPRPVRNYADWCLNALGESFSNAFTFRYTRKVWATEPENMTTDWIGPRVYQPTLQELVRGALSPQPANFHYITQYRYPLQGGFQSYLRGLMPRGQVHLGQAVVRLDMRRGELQLANGRTHGFDAMISSLPLPELIRCMPDAPRDVVDAAGKLVCTSIALVNVGLGRDEGFPDADWVYVYDEAIPFARISFPHRFAPGNVPAGCGSIQAEVYYSPLRPLPSQDVVSWVMDGLKRMGVLRPEDSVRVSLRQEMQYANVLFDHNRSASLAAVRGYLADQGVFTCGRYGRWEYLWTHTSITSAWHAAEGAMKRLGAAVKAEAVPA